MAAASFQTDRLDAIVDDLAAAESQTEKLGRIETDGRGIASLDGCDRVDPRPTPGVRLEGAGMVAACRR